MPHFYRLHGIFGGTFDPVHNGHLIAAHFLLNKLPFADLQLLPCQQPPHRPRPLATADHRLKMLQMAIQNFPGLNVNDLELKRSGPSYMVDTLQELNLIYPDDALGLILGIDVLTTLNQWHRWTDLLLFTHLIIINRPNYKLSEESWLKTFLQQHQCQNIQSLLTKKNGNIFLQEIPEQSISASQIRQLLAKKASIDKIVPINVAEYIETHQLYQS